MRNVVSCVAPGLGGDAVLRHARLFKIRLAVAAVQPPQAAIGSEDMSATAHGIPPEALIGFQGGEVGTLARG